MPRPTWTLFAIAVAACGGRTPAPTTAEPAPAAEPAAATATAPEPAAATTDDPAAHLPPPFTAAELRAGLPVGTEIVFKLEAAGQETQLQHWTFTAADDSGCTIAAKLLREDGSLISDEGEGTSSWAELESHAHFPAARSTRTESTVTVAAGTFDSWLFEVQPAAPDQPVKRLQFARTLPGPPVLMEVIAGGEVVMRMELLSRTQPQ
jgi:hypothetical protein